MSEPLNLYVLTVHEPYTAPEHPVEINGTVVHVKTLLHPRVPQPSGCLMYHAIIDYPGRRDGSIVPLSTLTSEVGGNLSSLAPDWEAVSEAVIQLARARECDAMPLGLPGAWLGLLAGGPKADLKVFNAASRTLEYYGPADRQAALAMLERQLGAHVAQGPFWPGDGLVPA